MSHKVRWSHLNTFFTIFFIQFSLPSVTANLKLWSLLLGNFSIVSHLTWWIIPPTFKMTVSLKAVPRNYREMMTVLETDLSLSRLNAEKNILTKWNVCMLWLYHLVTQWQVHEADNPPRCLRLRCQTQLRLREPALSLLAPCLMLWSLQHYN